MGDEEEKSSSTRTSDVQPSHSSQLSGHSSIKSEMHISVRNSQCKSTSSFKTHKNNYGEYYKRYEHDEIPVKEFSSSDFATGDNVRQFPKLTDSLLDRIEQKVLINCTQKPPERHADDTHIKFFKITVQEIFDTFYTALRDIESFKKRYQEIIKKCSPKQTEKEMAMFIKDIIQEIKSSESVRSEEVVEQNGSDTVAETSKLEFESDASVIQAYKNQKYDKESSAEDSVSTPSNKHQNNNEVLNIFFVNATPSVEIRVTDRHMLSEVNIKDSSAVQSRVISADNLKKIAEKKKTLDAIRNTTCEEEPQDREIPIKSGVPKKDLYLNEDFQCENDKNEKTLMQRLCSYICRKIRRTTS